MKRARLAMLFLALLTLATSAPLAWAHFEPVTCHNSFTTAQEIAEGNKAALQVYKAMPVLPENDPITQYVQQLGAKLVQHAPLTPGISQQWPFNFHVVASQEINAFALPGGSIFVNLGTVQAADTEAQLAGVMAHETSHVIMRHSTCNMIKQRNRGIFYQLGAIGSSVLLGNGAAGQLAQAGIGFGANMDFLHMSRGDEQQADLLGTDILYDSGYDPRALVQFFETLQAKYGNGGVQFFSDHPNPGNRTEYVNREIATLPRLPHPLVNTPEFRDIHKVAMQRKALTPKEIQAGAWRRTGQYATGPGNNGGTISDAGASGSNAAMAPLSSRQLGLDARLQRVSAPGSSIETPNSWSQNTGQDGTLTLAPQGGAGPAGLAYGALVSFQKESTPGSLDDQTRALVAQLTQGNSGLKQAGQAASLQVGGLPAEKVILRGVSPVVVDNEHLPEQDWLVTVSRSDGSLSYLVFVAPERDFGAMQSTFQSMLTSFRPS